MLAIHSMKFREALNYDRQIWLFLLWNIFVRYELSGHMYCDGFCMMCSGVTCDECFVVFGSGELDACDTYFQRDRLIVVFKDLW